ncbi:hypothetical protein [Rappaport israeli]|uniref:hypothetical protein n=1 Tax=Rappaport israeli TaxID=1839807 RepID=UPI00093160CA|nr:hypothetical protein [Rappaport israeli]
MNGHITYNVESALRQSLNESSKGFSVPIIGAQVLKRLFVGLPLLSLSLFMLVALKSYKSSACAPLCSYCACFNLQIG